jgi:predicted SnoaL-like aldol condensation-catalyzing enzyme
MSNDVNMAAQQHLGELLEQRAFDRFGEVWAEDVVDHDPAPGAAAGLAGIVAFWQEFTTAFPDVALQPGTHSGVFQGHAATGRTFSVRGLQTARFADGKIVERWGATDEKGLAEQLQLGGDTAHFVSA